MDTSETKPTLSALLAGQPIGTWVVLDPDMSRVLSAAPTVEEAIRQARIEPTAFDQAMGERPVMIQVPDPSMVCFY
jgi:hypothetical protein